MSAIPQNRATLALLASASVLAAACSERVPAPPAADSLIGAERPCDAPGVRTVVERLGARLKLVSLQAPDSAVRQAITTAYAPLVTPELLVAWTSEPASAPGRTTSSPWPERIETRAAEATEAGACRVEGTVVYVTSVEQTRGGAARREPVTLEVARDGGGWRVSAYRVAAQPASSVRQ